MFLYFKPTRKEKRNLWTRKTTPKYAHWMSENFVLDRLLDSHGSVNWFATRRTHLEVTPLDEQRFQPEIFVHVHKALYLIHPLISPYTCRRYSRSAARSNWDYCCNSHQSYAWLKRRFVRPQQYCCLLPFATAQSKLLQYSWIFFSWFQTKEKRCLRLSPRRLFKTGIECNN